MMIDPAQVVLCTATSTNLLQQQPLQQPGETAVATLGCSCYHHLA